MKKKLRLVAHTPGRDIFSTPYSYDDNIDDLQKLCEKVASLKYLMMETDEGFVYLPPGVIDQTVFVIETIEE